MEIKQAVILAGGQGMRLRPFTSENPKAMAPAAGKPFLEHLILMLKENGIQEVVVLTGYLGEKIRDYFGDGSRLGIRIKYSHTPFKNEQGQENESGLRLKNAKDLLHDHFLLMYCDNYWPLQLEKLEKFYTESKADILITVYSNKDHSTKNNILIDRDGYVAKYDRSRQDADLNEVDIGFFMLHKKVLDVLPEQNSHFEKDILSRLVSEKRVCGYITDHKYYSISDPGRVLLAGKFLASKKVIFLDRDGVINKKAPKADYIKNWSEFEFLPGAIQALTTLSNRGYDMYVITNQPGIVRGAMTRQDLDLIHTNMRNELLKNGVHINGIYACLHNWAEGCDCRKPKPGLLFQAAGEQYIDLTKTIFVSDDERDVEAGKAAGCKTILVDPEIGISEAIRSIP